MKAATLKTFIKLHSWTGLVAGMALFIAFYAGAMTVFFHELEVWDSYAGPPEAQQTVAQAQQLVEQVLARDPGAAEAFRLYLAEPDHPHHSAFWFERQADGNFKSHPYRLTDAATLDTEEETTHLAGFIYELHYTAGLPTRLGLYTLGIICLIYGLALVSGLIVFLPNFLKDLFVVRSPKNRKRFWLDAHNVVGVISLPWHFMFAWSSVLLAIGIFFLAPYQFLVFEEDLIGLFGAELGVLQTLDAAGQPGAMLPVADILRLAQEHLPGLQASQLRYFNAGDLNGAVSVQGTLTAGTVVPNASVLMSLVDGSVLRLNQPTDASVGATMYNGLVALHFASFGGYTLKWVYFLLGLAGAFLFYSGNLLWVESRRRRRQPMQRKDARLLARLNSGVCIGCMAGISAAFLMSRGLGPVPQRPELTELAYYLVFFAAIAWCLLRSVSRGTRDLLYLCAALTAAIPLANAVFIDMPLWRSLAWGEWPLVSVDLLAILGALIFWRLGKAVERRGHGADQNSVWAHPPAASDTPVEPQETLVKSAK